MIKVIKTTIRIIVVANTGLAPGDSVLPLGDQGIIFFDHSAIQPFNLILQKCSSAINLYGSSVSNGLAICFSSITCHAFSHSNGYYKERFRVRARGHLLVLHKTSTT